MASSNVLSLYKVKFRVNNYIYEEVMSAELFEDMRVNGLKSQVVKEVRKHDALSLAVGLFKHAVEIMFIEPCKEKETEDMETEVCFIKNFAFSYPTLPLSVNVYQKSCGTFSHSFSNRLQAQMV